MCPLPPRSTLFPYTTLFRSEGLFLSLFPRLGPAHRPGCLLDALDESREARAVQRHFGGPAVEHSGKERSLEPDRKSTRLNSSHEWISYAVFCLKKKKKKDKI